MRYGSTKQATNFQPQTWGLKVVKAVLFFIPRANPDHEKQYPKVKKWLLEVDAEGAPIRELGIDDKGYVLFRAPDKRNCGFWTDSNAKFLETDLVPIDPTEFETIWENADGKWR